MFPLLSLLSLRPVTCRHRSNSTGPRKRVQVSVIHETDFRPCENFSCWHVGCKADAGWRTVRLEKILEQRWQINDVSALRISIS